MPRKPRAPPRLLTTAELEIMSVLWSLGEASVHDLAERLPREQAYTTVSTLVRILEQKGFVRSRKDGRSHLYAATTGKPAYERATLRDLMARLFGGNAPALVRSLLSTQDLSTEDLTEIRRLVREKERR